MEYLALHFGRFIHLSEKHIYQLQKAVILHDIGKIIISQKIVNKPNQLTIEEYQLIKEHPLIGYWIAKSIHVSEVIALIILHHHEKWDGTGYPYGISQTQIPYLARVVAILDSYEAMADQRPYKRPMSKEEIIYELKINSETQFDPILTRDFIYFLKLNNFPCYFAHEKRESI